jgi:hypothetical protein
MMRDGALQLATVMLVAGSVACGRTNLDDGLAELSGDASILDVALDSKGYVEATVADSYAAADQGTAADSALDASPSLDDAEGPDGNTDAFTSDAAEQHLPCDQCSRGDQQCAPLPQVCTYNDAGVLLSCATPGQAISTCVAGDAGCAVWAQEVACRSDVPCCVPCRYSLACPLGNYGNPCEQDTDCAFDACDAVIHECVFDQCRDHRQDGQESDVDCGGPLCDACLGGQSCQTNFDCLSGHLCAPSHLCE